MGGGFGPRRRAGAMTLDGGLNTGDGAGATGATGAATDDVVIFVALGVNLAAAAGLDATGDGARSGRGLSETVEAFPEDSMLSVRWSADPGGTAVRTDLRLAIFVMSFSGDTTSGAGAAATDAGASPEPRSSRSPPTATPRQPSLRCGALGGSCLCVGDAAEEAANRGAGLYATCARRLTGASEAPIRPRDARALCAPSAVSRRALFPPEA